ncbi:MAG TPA: hypothetical protein VG095_08110 [Chthoniobacterales bacterium]|nr:hypothetical protein [Chthoniobacterales bacterium]
MHSPASRYDSSLTTVSSLVKFTALAAVLAMFGDAAIAHPILWGNDPYWTYWITDTLLMATVFGIGTAWLGAGLLRGAIITAIHMVLLTTYYWSFSPIGLPAQPEWLDLEHTWLTGVPVHFAVYYLGYVVALWLWRKQHGARPPPARPTSLAGEAMLALTIGAAVVIAAGLVQTIVLGEFPGATWFIVRIAVAVPFALAWRAIAGTDGPAAISGGLMLGFVLSTYGHYLGPIGLPNEPLRIFAENPPPAAVHWLTYREEFLIVLPISLLISVVAFLAAGAWRRHEGDWLRWNRAGVTGAVAAIVALTAIGIVVAGHTGSDAKRASVTSTGSVSVEQGAFYQGDMVPAAAGKLRMTVEDHTARATPLRPHDRVDLEASINHPNGTVYEIRATQPLVRDPQGRFTTWSGVGFDVWHHGRSGIGSSLLPAIRSNVAVFALGEVSANGAVIAAGVPVHAMTTSNDDGRLALDVGDAKIALPGIPDGHLRVVWSDYVGGYSGASKYARYALGTGMLIVLLSAAIIAARRDPRTMTP